MHACMPAVATLPAVSNFAESAYCCACCADPELVKEYMADPLNTGGAGACPPACLRYLSLGRLFK